ncbi:MAG: gamma-glutamyl-gamma-aminobutyrate hydrolase family protein [Beijerinckiaceae bacterium]
MGKPVIGVIANSYKIEDRFQMQGAGVRSLRAVCDVTGAMPLMFAASSDITDVETLLACASGIVLTGARANVHPRHYGVDPSPKHEPYDEERDELALKLVHLCVERAIPLLGLCRGFQEMNVAFGGTLHPEIRELPGRMNHRMQRLENGEMHPDPDVLFAERHDVHLTPGGVFAKIFGAETVLVNSLHGQGIMDCGERIIVEGVADDGTIEAIRIADAPGFALGVQWHAEYNPQTNAVNQSLFKAFGEAVRKRAGGG